MKDQVTKFIGNVLPKTLDAKNQKLYLLDYDVELELKIWLKIIWVSINGKMVS